VFVLTLDSQQKLFFLATKVTENHDRHDFPHAIREANIKAKNINSEKAGFNYFSST
jgi:hypothetical protein